MGRYRKRLKKQILVESIQPPSFLRYKLLFFKSRNVITGFSFFSYFCSSLIALILPLIQIRRTNSIYDISYMITNWYRISEGQLPYRDFILVHNPGSFLIGGILFKIFGTSYLVVVAWMCFVNLLTLFVINRILLKIKVSLVQRSIILIVISFVLPYSNVSSPNYDADSTCAMLICLNYLIHLISSKSESWRAWALFGGLSVLPFLFKQNVGAAFILSLLLVLYFLGSFRILVAFLGGLASWATILTLLMFKSQMLSNWWNFSVVVAAQSRLGDPLLPFKSLPEIGQFELIILSILSTFTLFKKPSSHKSNRVFMIVFLMLVIPVIMNLAENMRVFFSSISKVDTIAEFAAWGGLLFYSSIHVLFWVPWFFSFITSCFVMRRLLNQRNRGEEIVYLAMNIPILLHLYSALLSQGINGSTYSTGTLLVLQILTSFRIIHSVNFAQKTKKLSTLQTNNSILNKSSFLYYSSFVVALVLVYGISGVTGGRIGFADLTGGIAQNPRIAFMQTPGKYLPDQSYAEQILEKYGSNGKVVVFVPSAELGYILAKSPPLADVHTFDTTTNPYLSDLEKFLNCNLVDVIVYNSRNQVSMYRSFSWAKWPPPEDKYKPVSYYGPFMIFELRNEKVLNPQEFECPSTSYSRRNN